MKEIKSATRIYAPIEDIWEKLLNFDQYHTWNHAVKDIHGQPIRNSLFRLKLNPEPIKSTHLQTKLIVLESQKELVWSTTYLGINNLFGYQYYFNLIPKTQGRVKLIHGAVFWGFLLPLCWKYISMENRATLKEANEALRNEVESGIEIESRSVTE